MILKMFIIMGIIVIAGLVFAIWVLLLSSGQASRHERKLQKIYQDPEDEETEVRLLK